MYHIFLICSLMVFLLPTRAAALTYPRDILQWQETSAPPQTSQADRMVWFYAANHSRPWRVWSEQGHVYAEQASSEFPQPGERPAFTAQADRFGRATSYARVDDGWLAAFNKGEFGGSLYWFSANGKDSYEISDHQVVGFFSLPSGAYAIEGLNHLGIDHDSILHIARPDPQAHWQASVVAQLPSAPWAVSVRRDGTMFITLSDSLVSVSADYRIDTLASGSPWLGLYPNSSAFSSDQQKLYIGMRQFVAEFDIATGKPRLLIPSSAFLDTLPKADEARIRKQYGD